MRRFCPSVAVIPSALRAWLYFSIARTSIKERCEHLTDPQTGQMYELPFEQYDAKVGGYRNPNRPTDAGKTATGLLIAACA